MMKILCIVMFAASLIGGASVVMAQSSRDLLRLWTKLPLLSVMGKGHSPLRCRSRHAALNSNPCRPQQRALHAR